MKRKNTRTMGMTGTQIGILAGLGVVALLSIGTLLWIVISSNSFSGGPPAQPADLPTPLPAMPTLFLPTATGPLPTATETPAPIATTPPQAGWIQFTTQGASLWLPASFVGGDTFQHRSETIKAISKLGKFFKNVVATLPKQPPEVVMWIVDKNVSSAVLTTVIVSHYARSADTTLDQFIQEVLYGSPTSVSTPNPVTVNETRKMTLLGREARLLIYNQQFVGYEVTGVVYFIKDGADFWTIDYNLDPNEYLDRLPIVEQSIQTFDLVK